MKEDDNHMHMYLYVICPEHGKRKIHLTKSWVWFKNLKAEGKDKFDVYCDFCDAIHTYQIDDVRAEHRKDFGLKIIAISFILGIILGSIHILLFLGVGIAGIFLATASEEMAIEWVIKFNRRQRYNRIVKDFKTIRDNIPDNNKDKGYDLELRCNKFYSLIGKINEYYNNTHEYESINISLKNIKDYLNSKEPEDLTLKSINKLEKMLDEIKY